MKAFYLALVVLALITTACEKEGPAERAGEKIDRTVEKVGDKIEDATDRK